MALELKLSSREKGYEGIMGMRERREEIIQEMAGREDQRGREMKAEKGH